MSQRPLYSDVQGGFEMFAQKKPPKGGSHEKKKGPPDEDEFESDGAFKKEDKKMKKADKESSKRIKASQQQQQQQQQKNGAKKETFVDAMSSMKNLSRAGRDMKHRGESKETFVADEKEKQEEEDDDDDDEFEVPGSGKPMKLEHFTDEMKRSITEKKGIEDELEPFMDEFDYEPEVGHVQMMKAQKRPTQMRETFADKEIPSFPDALGTKKEVDDKDDNMMDDDDDQDDADDENDENDEQPKPAPPELYTNYCPI